MIRDELSAIVFGVAPRDRQLSRGRDADELEPARRGVVEGAVRTMGRHHVGRILGEQLIKLTGPLGLRLALDDRDSSVA